MRAIAIVALLTLTLSAPALATEPTVTQRSVPKSGQLTLTKEVVGAETFGASAKPMTLRSHRTADKVAVTLNCENDNVIDLANTLLISPGDFVGGIFAPPVTPNPFHLREVSFGLVDFGQVYPATVLVEIYEDDGLGSYQFVTGFAVDIPTSPGGGTIYNVDVSAFNIILSNEVLTLYGDDLPSEGGYMVPTGDSSPRCFTGDNVCSVHLPASNPSLFIYGVNDPGCPPNNILLFDLTHELVVDEIPVATLPASFGEVKSKFEE